VTGDSRNALIGKIVAACQEWRTSHTDRTHLEAGVTEWNHWRASNSTVTPDLSGLDLSGAALSGVDFSRTKLIRTNLSGTDLSGANLAGADLGQANLSGANLTQGDLTDADLIWAKLVETNFTQANLTRTKLIECDLIGAVLLRATLVDAKLSRASFMDSILREADLSRAKMVGANFSEADLRRARLTGVSAVGADFLGADLSESSLVGADLSRASLNNAHLVRANLQRANLSQVQARGTKFSGAKLTGACLSGWEIDDNTRLNDVRCGFVYLGTGGGDRYPEVGREFGEGELEQLVRESVQTVELLLLDGVDWAALRAALQAIMGQRPELRLAVRSFERSQLGKLVLRVEMRSAIERQTLASLLHREYYRSLDEMAQWYRQERGLSSEQVDELRLAGMDLMAMVDWMAERSLAATAAIAAAASGPLVSAPGASAGVGADSHPSNPPSMLQQRS
jgi:uncharacterized protein YjbI with pentapeptide repeats